MTSARIPDLDANQVPDNPPVALSWQASLAMTGLVPASLVLAWTLPPREGLPITSIVGLLLVLLALGTLLAIVGERIGQAKHDQPQDR